LDATAVGSNDEGEGRCESSQRGARRKPFANPSRCILAATAISTATTAAAAAAAATATAASTATPSAAEVIVGIEIVVGHLSRRCGDASRRSFPFNG
jgi:hypothetical protein